MLCFLLGYSQVFITLIYFQFCCHAENSKVKLFITLICILGSCGWNKIFPWDENVTIRVVKITVFILRQLLFVKAFWFFSFFFLSYLKKNVSMFSLLKHVRNLAIFMYRFQINVYCTSVEKNERFFCTFHLFLNYFINCLFLKFQVQQILFPI